MTPEAKVKTRVKRVLEELGAYFFSPQSGIYGRSGIPDIVGCYRGKFFAVECKAGTNTTTALQDKEIDKIRAARGMVFVVHERNIDEWEAIMRREL